MSGAADEERIEEVLEEWFGQLDAEGNVDKGTRERWFKKDPAFDAHIRRNYERDVRRALAGEYDDWTKTARGSLAIVILLDQMTRTMFRGSAEMYCGDARTVSITQRTIEKGLDVSLSLIERHFLCLPLMHAEDVAVQDRCIEELQRLADAGGMDAVTFAHGHRDIVVRFGRFPHRNELLGRESTDDELEFLQQPGSSF